MEEIDGARINQMNYREAMARPKHYAETTFEINCRCYAKHIRTDRETLAAHVEDTAAPLQERFAAGNILALIGDPRITCDDPLMLYVPGGTFTMGSDPRAVQGTVERYRKFGVLAAWVEKETPSFSARVAPFKIAKYLVTNEEFRLYLLDTKSQFVPTSWHLGRYPEHHANHPVYSVTPDIADDYANWLSGKTGRNFRLPTEAEWEFAAGAARNREFPWGDEPLDQVCNTAELCLVSTTPVGMFPEGNSPYGLADAAGNVEELVADIYAPYPGGRFVSDDIARRDPEYRMTRGGGFTRFKDLARCKRRHGYFDSCLYPVGFRLCED
ncbi:formylglycine-generating enzyme family protein [Ferruginivarius sediminum]|uniref:Serine/threonine protein kinase n=1 Tax=Ferruginivarius sediminum TaxID=2661937 RepID=A0A369TCJ0_9PROT|nr:SUMF1/EgtB/PvdO family nonheme iron enzyme [Ferruginivarius sediminum]RDD63000.1 serine/threonine protein kinase [Ferruginivarius sediminum]